MHDLTTEEKKFFEGLMKISFCKEKSGYYKCKYKGKHYKKSRLIMQLHLNKKLEPWEIVHHKDTNKENDLIENLELINENLNSIHASHHHAGNPNQKPKGWKPANTTKKEVIEKINRIASEMIKINCSEIARRLKKEGISISSFTAKKYLTPL